MAKPKKTAEPKIIRPDDIDPHHDWKRPLHAPGHTQVDFEERVNFRRLHDYRLARVRAALAASGLGALLSFDQHNIRYTTSTVIGEWARDKLTRYSLLTGTGDPYIWDFGSAAKHHRLYAPWLHVDHCKAGLLGLRGAVGSDVTLFRDAAKEIKAILDAEGVGNMPLGLDVVEPPMLFELQKLGIEVRDGQQVMLQAREVKNIDELTLLNMASAMVDGVYQDIAEALKPGVKESQIVALATARLYEMGSDCVEAINSISGERCSPLEARNVERQNRPRFPGGEGNRVCERDGSVRPELLPRAGARPARAPADLAALFVQGADRAESGHGVRRGDLLPRDRRYLGRAHRGGGDPHARGREDHLPLSR
jgi:Xaa-Pro dipeptidase